MFKFAATSIINSVNYLDTKTARFKAVGDKFKVKHNSIIIEKDNVMAAFTREASEGECAIAEIAEVKGLTYSKDKTVETGDIIRVKIYVRLSMSDQDSYYANDLVYKGKPFIFEYKVGDTDAQIKKIADEIATMENVQLDFTVSGGAITIEGKKATQNFKSVEVEVWDPEVKTTYPGQVGAFVPVEPATPAEGEEASEVVTITPAVEAFGTYAYLMKDLVLPTYENIRWAGQQVDERPIPGAKYTQYIVHICKNRGIMGGDAVGEASKSITTHIFWVNETIKSEFEDAIAVAVPTFNKYNTVTAADIVKETGAGDGAPLATAMVDDDELVEADLVEKKN